MFLSAHSNSPSPAWQKVHGLHIKTTFMTTISCLGFWEIFHWTLTRISEPWMIKERVWFFGTTAWIRGKPSLTTWGEHGTHEWSQSRRMWPKKGYLITHLYKGPQFCELFKDIQGHSVQAGLPPHCVFSRHAGRMRLLVDKPELDQNSLYIGGFF